MYGGKCLDAQPTGAPPGSGVLLWNCDGSETQLFGFSAFGDGLRAEVRASRLCLHVADASPDNGALLQQQPCSASVAQKFTVVPTGEWVPSTRAWVCLGVCGSLTSRHQATGGAWGVSMQESTGT